ncbi:MAG: hypothetical protein EOM10_13635 [Opitutae bacterium]|nr:hypothetical protein [Opitutae bacterium]
MGEMIAYQRAGQARQAEATSVQEARDLHARRAAEWQAARADLAATTRTEWWDRATVEDIAHTYQTATAWAPVEAEAGRYRDTMRDQIRTRYGVDVDGAVDDAAVARRIKDELDRQAEMERTRANAEVVEAAALMEHADRVDRAAEERDNRAQQVEAEHLRDDAGLVYDSAERREALAAELRRKGVDGKAIEARVTADVGNAKPATEAVRTKAARRTSRVSKGRTVGRAHVGVER